MSNETWILVGVLAVGAVLFIVWRRKKAAGGGTVVINGKPLNLDRGLVVAGPVSPSSRPTPAKPPAVPGWAR